MMESNTITNDNNNKSALQENIDRKGSNAYYFAHAHKANGPAWDGKPEPKLLSRSLSSDKHNNSEDGSFTATNTNTTSAASATGGMGTTTIHSTFEYHKSNITTYAFLDEENWVKIYVDLPGVGERCTDDNITLDFTEQSFCLQVNNYIPPMTVLTPSSSSSLSSSSSAAAPGIALNDPSTSTDMSSSMPLTSTSPTITPPPAAAAAAVSTSSSVVIPRCLSFARLAATITDATYRLKPNRIIITLAKKENRPWHTIHDKGMPDHEVV
jgi:hypothetical protein